MERPPRSPLRTQTKRYHALHELLSSERAYASDLALIREVHIPLAQGTSKKITTIVNSLLYQAKYIIHR